jgi:uncharacterized protein DUF5996
MTDADQSVAHTAWPEPPRDWAETQATFHLWLQVVGKIRMVSTPVVSHWWNTPLYLTATGLTTSLMPHGTGRGFQIDLDLLEHELVIRATDGTKRSRRLRP